MYQCKINITILNGKDDMVNTLSKLEMPEDCLCSIIAADSIDASVSGEDSAVIICGDDKEIEHARQLGAGYVVFMADIDRIASADSNILSSAYCIWTMPESGCDSKLLQLYGSRLINDMKQAADYRMLKICFDTSINSIPDLIWFKDVKGAHLTVNNGFCKAVQKTKEQIYKKGHYYIWDIPKEEYDMGDYVCLESEKVVMDARKTCLFDEKVKTKSGMRLFKTYKSPLIDSNGDIFGTCGIAHDVTDLQNINNEIAILLESMPFAVMVEDINGKAVSCNSKFYAYFPEKTDIVGQNCLEWKQELFGRMECTDDVAELHIIIDGDEKILSFRTEYVTDIFKEHIGKINIFQDVTPEHSSRQKALLSANTDFLTSLDNRRSLFMHLNSCALLPQLSLVMVDLDNFKKVNDNFGHKAGDDALIETARILKRCFKDDFIARMGGDEFMIAVKRSCTADELEVQANELLDMLKSSFAEKDEFKIMTASVGIAQSVLTDGGRHDIEGLMHLSDAALYNAKNSGKGRCCVYGKM